MNSMQAKARLDEAPKAKRGHPWIIPLILVAAISVVLPFYCHQPFGGVLLAPTAIIWAVLAWKATSQTEDSRSSVSFLSACEVLKIGGIVAFCWEFPENDFSSGLALAIAALLAVMVALHSNSTISESADSFEGGGGGALGQLAQLIARVLRHFRLFRLPLFGFISLFLYVTYFLTLALAFHDKSEESAGRRALFVVAKDTVVEIATANGSGLGDPAQTAETPGGEGGSQSLKGRFEQSCDAVFPRSYTLFFQQSSASFGSCETEAVSEIIGSRPSDESKVKDVVDDLVVVDELKEECRDMSTISRQNVAALICFRAAVQEQVRETPYRRLQVKLVGHATEERPDPSRFPSNYELSEARVQGAHMLLSDLLRAVAREANVEWVHVPRSSEIGTAPEISRGGSVDDVEHQLSVDVSIDSLPDLLKQRHAEVLMAPPPSLELLDYLYFMIYTITTTGYGDMRPVTPLAKFICSVANLFEVLFLVILFNVIVGHRRSDAEIGGGGTAAETGTGGGLS